MTVPFTMKTTAQHESSTTSGAAATADQRTAHSLSAALDQLWIKFLPEIRARVEVLEAAAAASAAHELSTVQREAAKAAAHKLAGILGTFNLTGGTELAREFEVLFAGDDTTNPSLAGRSASIAAELRTIVAGRK